MGIGDPRVVVRAEYKKKSRVRKLDHRVRPREHLALQEVNCKSMATCVKGRLRIGEQQS